MSLISVITPVHNSEKFIKRTIQSILLQTFTEFEYIIVDDHSSDRTIKIIKEFEDGRIKIFNAEKRGSVPAYNQALYNSAGKYIAVIDHDDVAEPERFEKQVKILNEDKADVVGTFYKIIDESDTLLSKQKLPVEDSGIKNMMLYRNAVTHTSSMYKRDLIQKFGCYREDRFPSHDFDLWIRIMDKIKFYNIPEFLQSWRVVKSSPSQQLFDLQQKKSFEILEEYFQKNIEDESHKEFLTGRAKYYFISPESAAGHFMRSIKKGKLNFQILKYFFKSAFLALPVRKYRNLIGKKYYGKA